MPTAVLIHGALNMGLVESILEEDNDGEDLNDEDDLLSLPVFHGAIWTLDPLQV